MNNKLVESIGGVLAKKGSLALLKLKNVSPEILIGAGIISIVAGTVLACKATLKVDDILDEHERNMLAINTAHEEVKDFIDDDVRQEKALTYFQTGKSFLKIYWPSAVLMGGGIIFLISSHGIMRQRNAALAAAYSVIDTAFREYRGRVVDELGADKDFHFMHNTTYETITEETTDESGKKKKTKKEIQVLNEDGGTSMYARWYAKQEWDIKDGSYTGSSQWVNNPDYNATNLILKNSMLNDTLKARGYLFLNDVYEELGFPRTKAGQIVGWVWDGDGDNYVSFGPEVDGLINKTKTSIIYRPGGSILLDFNVDGPILELLK